MNGIKQSVKVTLRNPLDKKDFLNYYITPNDTQLAKDWTSALEALLKSKKLFKKRTRTVNISPNGFKATIGII
jgi:hypothetical protein